MSNKYLRQFKKGVLEIIILQFLKSKEMYGYELTSLLNNRSEILEIKEGTLYPILYRLEDDKLIEGKWEHLNSKESRGVPKKYYCITEKGILVLNESKELWSQFSRLVDEILEEEE